MTKKSSIGWFQLKKAVESMAEEYLPADDNEGMVEDIIQRLKDDPNLGWVSATEDAIRESIRAQVGHSVEGLSLEDASEYLRLHRMAGGN
jgi:hypothetical protein